ncbi:MAG: hypothetical protein B7Z08_04075 [Sphingomonadales bacterium 32-68-7]|nr:MAG: hypothetical protein B7Z08_04075 [Sphingomonadales bacterium 32-68-7]
MRETGPAARRMLHGYQPINRSHEEPPTMRSYVLGALCSACLAVPAQAATIYGVDENNNLVTFQSTNPSTFTSTRAISGTAATMLGIDFRDSNNLLYGLGDDLRLYTIDIGTGVASAIGGQLSLTGTNFGFDFNTALDALRIVSNNGTNYVVNPNTGTASQFTNVAFGPGDANAGATPLVTANGYIHGTGTQYAISTSVDALVTQANNAGTLATVGALGVAVGPRTSFAATWLMMILGFGFVGMAMRARPAAPRRIRA